MTPYNPSRHHRRSIRLKDYDYTQPRAYFVTICTYEHAHRFGAVVDGDVQLNYAGRIAERCWRDIPAHFPHVELDVFVIMPNHIHGVLWITANVGARHAAPLHSAPTTLQTEQFGKPVAGSIPTIIRSYKSAVTCRIHALPDSTDVSVWQRNYYEHVIRDDRAMNAIRRYILGNPSRWDLDRYNPDCRGDDPLAREIWESFCKDAARRTPTGAPTLELLPRPSPPGVAKD